MWLVPQVMDSIANAGSDDVDFASFLHWFHQVPRASCARTCTFQTYCFPKAMLKHQLAH